LPASRLYLAVELWQLGLDRVQPLLDGVAAADSTPEPLSMSDPVAVIGRRS